MAKFDDNLIQLNTLVDDASKYDEIATYTLSNKQDMQFYPYFSRTKINEVLEEFQSYMQSDNKDDKKFMDAVTEDEKNSLIFWYFLLIKKFTHFGEQMKKVKNVRGLIPYYNALLETGLLEEIVNEVFLFEEVQKFNNSISNQLALMQAGMEVLNNYEDKLDKHREKLKENIGVKSE